MARSPLALLRYWKSPTENGWRSVQTEQAARGMSADKVVFVREPTDQERKSVMACLWAGRRDQVYSLDELIDLRIDCDYVPAAL